MKQHTFDLDAPLVTFGGDDGKAAFTIRDSFESVVIFGSSVAGKSSGVARLYAERFIQAGYGGIVLSVKSERDTWTEYCKKYNALDRLVIVEPFGEHSFNFLDYEYATSDSSIPYTENIYQLLHTVLKASQDKQGAKTDDFWEGALESLITHAIDLCYLAFGSLSIESLYSVVLSAPKPEPSDDNETKSSFITAFEKAQENVQRKINAFEQEQAQKGITVEQDREAYEKAMLNAIPEAEQLKRIDQFFIESYRHLSPKTRSIVDFSFSSLLQHFLREPIRSLFCNDCTTSFTPEDCFNDGKIILLDIPVKKYQKIARDAQILFKLIFQRAAEKRIIDDTTRPCFIWSDEGHALLHELDTDFLATSRSSRIATVLITQNLPGLYSNMGGAKAEYRVKALLATLGTKFFCSNADVDTNKYASDLIGEGYTEDQNNTVTISGEFSSSQTKSYKLEKMVRPEQFSGLRCGGAKNNFLVDAYMHRQNQLFSDGLPFRKVTFKQQ